MQGPSHELPGKVQAAPLPKVINHTAWPAQYFQHVDPHDQGFHVMVSRMSYTLERLSVNADGVLVPQLLEPDQQTPLNTQDLFEGEPNVSELLEESDFSPYKPLCDVLLVNAVAYSPQGKPTPRWRVGLRFGQAIDKTLEVTGPWLQGNPIKKAATPKPAAQPGDSPGTDGHSATEPEAVAQVALGYQRAYGGPLLHKPRQWVEWLAGQAGSPTQAKAQSLLQRWPAAHAANPLGAGHDWSAAVALQRELAQLSATQGQPPTAEQLHAAIDHSRRGPQVQAPGQAYSGQSDYPALGFGPIGRWWRPRVEWAGTHDEQWKEKQWPKSPLDHNYRYWNSAPADQQVPWPQGGEVIELTHLTPLPGQQGGPVKLQLPRQEMRLLVRLQVGAVLFAPMRIDTVILDFKAKRLIVVRRAAVSAKAPVRQLELGTWGAGTTIELSDGQQVPIPEFRQPASSPPAPPVQAPGRSPQPEGSHHGP